jgi:hypothetical protein
LTSRWGKRMRRRANRSRGAYFKMLNEHSSLRRGRLTSRWGNRTNKKRVCRSRRAYF